LAVFNHVITYESSIDSLGLETVVTTLEYDDGFGDRRSWQYTFPRTLTLVEQPDWQTYEEWSNDPYITFSGLFITGTATNGSSLISGTVLNNLSNGYVSAFANGQEYTCALCYQNGTSGPMQSVMIGDAVNIFERCDVTNLDNHFWSASKMTPLDQLVCINAIVRDTAGRDICKFRLDPFEVLADDSEYLQLLRQ
jgi:hypothetical protein